MKRLVLGFLAFAIVSATLYSPDVFASQRRRVVVRTRPHRTTLVVRTGHPVRRRLPTTVVVRPARKTVVVGAPLVYLPAVAWTPTVVTIPPRDRLVWQDSETIDRDEGWVDSNFGVDENGDVLFLEINGRADLNFAEITFAGGNVQVVDFNEQTHGSGIYRLLDFADGRHVKTVRILAKSNSEDTKLIVYLRK